MAFKSDRGGTLGLMHLQSSTKAIQLSFPQTSCCSRITYSVILSQNSQNKIKIAFFPPLWLLGGPVLPEALSMFTYKKPRTSWGTCSTGENHHCMLQPHKDSLSHCISLLPCSWLSTFSAIAYTKCTWTHLSLLLIWAPPNLLQAFPWCVNFQGSGIAGMHLCRRLFVSAAQSLLVRI